MRDASASIILLQGLLADPEADISTLTRAKVLVAVNALARDLSMMVEELEREAGRSEVATRARSAPPNEAFPTSENKVIPRRLWSVGTPTHASGRIFSGAGTSSRSSLVMAGRSSFR